MSEPTRIGKIAPEDIQRLVDSKKEKSETVWHVEQVHDPQARRIRAVRHQVEVRKSPLAWEHGYRCKICCDRGVISYIQEQYHGARLVEYSFVARCLCPKAATINPNIPSYHDIFGEWPDPQF